MADWIAILVGAGMTLDASAKAGIAAVISRLVVGDEIIVVIFGQLLDAPRTVGKPVIAIVRIVLQMRGNRQFQPRFVAHAFAAPAFFPGRGRTGMGGLLLLGFTRCGLCFHGGLSARLCHHPCLQYSLAASASLS